jgi:hypothetical protein
MTHTFTSSLVAGMACLFGVLVGSAPLLADDFVIDSPSFVTNTLGGDDTLAITPDGSIEPPSGDKGVLSTGGNNVITNSGAITTTGDDAFGIWNLVSDNSPITNSGSITTSGIRAVGIYNESLNNSAITNSGSITTSGDFAYGIWNASSDNSPITNSGAITTSGTGARGIYNESLDNSPITNSGSITTTGANAYGILNQQSPDSPITNSGSITTSGIEAYGILNDESSGSPITNSGSITTSGIRAYGIWNLDSPESPITNSGSITTSGTLAYGILNEASSDSPITNSGSITTTGVGGHGIINALSSNSPITNSGAITTSGDFAEGIFNFKSPDSPITNSGAITTSGTLAYGIWNQDSSDSPITNSGSITTTGAGAFGIWNLLSPNSPITNSGRIVSERSDSIRIEGGDPGVLNLNAPGYLGGAITLPSPTTVNLTTGKSHSVLWTLPNAPTSISGPVPWFYNSTTGKFATYDPSGLAGAVNELGDLTGLLSMVGRKGLASDCSAKGTAGVPGGSGRAPEATAVSPACAGPGLWITGFGGSIDHDGDSITYDQTFDQTGVAAGYSWSAYRGLQLGVMGGYVQSDMDIDDSRFAPTGSTDSDGGFLGFNGEQALGAFIVDFGITGGWLSHDGSRFINDNLALTNGLTLGKSWADASYDSWFISPQIGIAADFVQGDGWVLTPSARLRYARQSIDGFTETGSNADATVGSRDLSMLEASAEIAATKSLAFGTVTGRLGYLSRTSTGDENAEITLLSIDNTVPFGNTDSEAFYVGLGTYIGIAPNLSLQLDSQGYFGGDFTGYQGMATLVGRF